MKKSFFLALASLIGTIIGAGIFGIPFVVSKSGVLPSLFYFILLGFVVFFLHLFFAEIILKTKGNHRLVGYAKKYLGPKAKTIVGIATILGVLGSLLAYIILLGKFAHLILPWFSDLGWSFFLWAILSFLVLLGIKMISKAELYMNIGLFLVFLLVFAFCVPKIEASNIVLFNTENLFLPFGIVLFSLLGTSAVPEAISILKEKKSIKKIIVFGSLITVLFTFLFGFVISAVSGIRTTQEAFSGLSSFLGEKVIMLGALFGLLAVSTSFLILANYLKNTLKFDYKLSHLTSFAVSCFTPMALFLLGLRQFISVIGIVGTFVGLAEGVALILIYKKVKRKTNNIFLYCLIGVFVLGALLQIIYG